MAGSPVVIYIVFEGKNSMSIVRGQIG